MLENDNNIEVQGARVHNLKNIDISIPREKLVVITGLSGSGKSSLAMAVPTWSVFCWLGWRCCYLCAIPKLPRGPPCWCAPTRCWKSDFLTFENPSAKGTTLGSPIKCTFICWCTGVWRAHYLPMRAVRWRTALPVPFAGYLQHCLRGGPWFFRKISPCCPWALLSPYLPTQPSTHGWPSSGGVCHCLNENQCQPPWILRKQLWKP